MTVPSSIADLGFRSTKAFQLAWNLGTRLAPDGIAGPKTLAAAAVSAKCHKAGLGDLSANFSASEAHCHCGGMLSGCQGVVVRRELLQALEVLRAHVGGPLPVIDIYRCAAHNRQVGGARESQHADGTAADVAAALGLSVTEVRALHVFSGIGSGASTRTVQHVDVRHLGRNPTGGTPLAPTLWTYPER